MISFSSRFVQLLGLVSAAVTRPAAALVGAALFVRFPRPAQPDASNRRLDSENAVSAARSRPLVPPAAAERHVPGLVLESGRGKQGTVSAEQLRAGQHDDPGTRSDRIRTEAAVHSGRTEPTVQLEFFCHHCVTHNDSKRRFQLSARIRTWVQCERRREWEPRFGRVVGRNRGLELRQRWQQWWRCRWWRRLGRQVRFCFEFGRSAERRVELTSSCVQCKWLHRSSYFSKVSEFVVSRNSCSTCAHHSHARHTNKHTSLLNRTLV